MEVGLEQDTSASGSERQHAATPRDVRRVLMRERRAAAWRHLNVLERDVIIVFSALCKVQQCITAVHYPAPPGNYVLHYMSHVQVWIIAIFDTLFIASNCAIFIHSTV